MQETEKIMNKYLLMITRHDPFTPESGHPDKEFRYPEGPKHAAVLLWEKNFFSGIAVHYTGILYKINLAELSIKKIVKKIGIPSIKFEDVPAE